MVSNLMPEGTARKRLIMIMLLCLALAGCGGGGGSASIPDANHDLTGVWATVITNGWDTDPMTDEVESTTGLTGELQFIEQGGQVYFVFELEDGDQLRLVTQSGATCSFTTREDWLPMGGNPSEGYFETTYNLQVNDDNFTGRAVGREHFVHGDRAGEVVIASDESFTGTRQ